MYLKKIISGIVIVCAAAHALSAYPRTSEAHHWNLVPYLFDSRRDLLMLPVVHVAEGTAQPQFSYWEQETGELQLLALLQSYPAIVDDLSYVKDDWTIAVRGRRFYWAHARILPKQERKNYQHYTSIRFYDYYLGALQLPTVSPAQADRLKTLYDNPALKSASRHNGFLDALYGITTREDAMQRMVTISFLNHPVEIHRMIVDPLKNVERKIIRAAQADPRTARAVNNISRLSGYYWRTIRGTQSRSYHSYGVAIDLLSQSYQRKKVYWRWTAEQGITEWWKVPLEQRWIMAQAIVDAFESEGFVWGGKWLFYDALHFEYRPEIIQLAKIRS